MYVVKKIMLIYNSNSSIPRGQATV